MKILGWIKKGSKDKLKELLEGFELPSFPDVIMEALSVLRDDGASMREIADILQRDPGMHVQILRMVNSAAYGLSTKVGNIHHAVTMLGRSRIESMLLSHAVKETLPCVSIPAFNGKRFWLTAARRANLAYMLSEFLHPVFKDEAFTVGLLQDMAVPVIANVKKNEYNAILEHVYSTDGRDQVVIEKEKLGFDHQEVGAIMAEEWNLPEYISISIRNHHSISEKDAKDLAVRLVSFINERHEFDDMERFIDEWEEILQIDKEKMKSLTKDAFEKADDFFHSLY